MQVSTHRLTDRLKRVLTFAEEEGQGKVLQPVHLLIGSLREKSGVLGEILLKGDFDFLSLREFAGQPIGQTSTSNDFFQSRVSPKVNAIMEQAIEYMNRYNQIHLNEGHVLKALILSKQLDSILTSKQNEIILSHGTTSRDLITHLPSYTPPEKTSFIDIKRAEATDKQPLIDFIKKNFSNEWAETIEKGFNVNTQVPIFIALNDQQDIIGFACYDTYKKKKGYYGPMGVIQTERANGIGSNLVCTCLMEMKEIGYEYVVFGGAGPIEFYEKICNAVVIPKY
ncbi:GNAT family N-acetyltransferase [Falsibacillus albus]|uniref:GNAT family N-acetyltransferase n=1 Tax=Falsibacillus albus TaxID=2478915 RepID=A0A3L7K0Q5_9BACI|nr:GNAT family N-acetyltransferase [Falsibacillus albus]RLQ94222.1 GNAT family N-acetyltransferase [Falsibacillus albus]